MYCQQLSRCLIGAGDVVGVFHLSNLSPRRPARLQRSQGADGVCTFHCIDGAEYSRQADWPNPFLSRSFAEVLAEFAPDVVHFHNYLSLGDDLVGLAKAQGAAVVYTLHDYGLICPNHLLLRCDGSLCDKADPDFFASCCPQLLRTAAGRRPLLASRLPSLARWRMFADHYPHRRRRALLQGAVGAAERLLGQPETTAVEAKRTFFQQSTRRLFAQVDLFLSPSQFLRQRYLACGLPAERVQHLRYGMKHFPKPQHHPSSDGRLRFGYIGAFHAHKGIGVLLQAFAGLGDRANLHLHGSSFGSPVSEAHFRRLTSQPGHGVVVHGRYDNSRISELLADLDAVIVPSVWFENEPLTIQEAQIAGVPVITGNQGGMAELVRDGVDGLHFRIGDPQDLRRALLLLIDNPGLLLKFRANSPKVPKIEDQALMVRDHYFTLSKLRDQDSACQPHERSA